MRPKITRSFDGSLFLPLEGGWTIWVSATGAMLLDDKGTFHLYLDTLYQEGNWAFANEEDDWVPTEPPLTDTEQFAEAAMERMLRGRKDGKHEGNFRPGPSKAWGKHSAE